MTNRYIGSIDGKVRERIGKARACSPCCSTEPTSFTATIHWPGPIMYSSKPGAVQFPDIPLLRNITVPPIIAAEPPRRISWLMIIGDIVIPIVGSVSLKTPLFATFYCVLVLVSGLIGFPSFRKRWTRKS